MRKTLLVAASALLMASGVPAFAQQMDHNTANTPGGADAGSPQGTPPGTSNRATSQPNQDVQPSRTSPNTANTPGGSDAGSSSNQ